jgi:DnaK suppressor protein
MYNPGLFFPRQESQMPAKKAASKKRKKATTKRKKVTTKKTATRKKSANKKAVSRKKTPARKKVSKKKVARKSASKKKTTKKKVAKKATSTKKSARKKAAKKVGKKKAVSKKKPASRKKTASKKKTTSKKKTVGKKRPASKKKAVSKKRTVVKKKVPPSKPATRKIPTRKSTARRQGDVLSGPIHGIQPYKPKRGEEYMSDAQLEHFRRILNAWKRELMLEVDRTVHHMQDEAANFPDPNDRATQESEFGLELRTRDRERKLLRKIDSALVRIDEGSYGFCEETGEEIGLKRLEARPDALPRSPGTAGARRATVPRPGRSLPVIATSAGLRPRRPARCISARWSRPLPVIWKPGSVMGAGFFVSRTSIRPASKWEPRP